MVNVNHFSLICGLIAVIGLNMVNCKDFYTEKPCFLLTCKIQEPGFTKCFTNTVQRLFNQLTIGIPEISDTFGSVEPIHVKKLQFKHDNNEVVTIRGNLTDISVKGFSKSLIKESIVSETDYSRQTKIFMPKMRLDANYEMSGRILQVPLQANGKAFIEIENLDIILLTKSQLYEKAGFTFYNVTSVRALLNVTHVSARFNNLFNGRNKEFERRIHEYYQKNWRDLYEALKPLITETVESILSDLINKIFNLIPANFFVDDLPTSSQFYGTPGLH